MRFEHLIRRLRLVPNFGIEPARCASLPGSMGSRLDTCDLIVCQLANAMSDVASFYEGLALAKNPGLQWY